MFKIKITKGKEYGRNKVTGTIDDNDEVQINVFPNGYIIDLITPIDL